MVSYSTVERIFSNHRFSWSLTLFEFASLKEVHHPPPSLFWIFTGVKIEFLFHWSPVATPDLKKALVRRSKSKSLLIFSPSPLVEEMADDRGIAQSDKKDLAPVSTADEKKPKGFLSRIWNGICRIRGDDFEKRLQYISKEEAAVLSRMKRRSQTWTRMTRHLIIFSVLFEVLAVVYAIMTTRTFDMNWQMRAFRVLPMFLLPALSSAAYSSIVSFTKICDRRDQKTLEKLRAERQAKIEELKEKTNYYTTQQLIQRYDPDPAAKAAAATVLASKLGADSGLKVYVGDGSQHDGPTGKSNDMEVMQSRGLRNRKQPQTRSSSTRSTPLHPSEDETLAQHSGGSKGLLTSEHNQQVVVEHHCPQGSTTHDGSWISRIAALLVGEDPSQSYALICGNCHMHNGLTRKEDFPYITYFCPHCHVLNIPNPSAEPASVNVPDTVGSLLTTQSHVINNSSGSVIDEGNSAVVTAREETKEEAER